MPNIAFRFPTGRYHATPWGNHVNEGLVEWPPSPWRIVRALLATGFSKLGWREPLPGAARDLVEALSSGLPTYRLPPAVASHTRHFMPTDSKNPEDRTKIFDAFAQVGKMAEIVVSWEVELSVRAEQLLEMLVPKLSYLGRAESIVSARLVTDAATLMGERVTTVHRPNLEPISLLAPLPLVDYAKWRAESALTTTSATKRSKKTPESPYPEDAIAALHVDTGFLQKHGWTQPPGSRRVVYYRTPLETAPVAGIRRSAPRVNADTALLALASDTRRRDVLPPMARALPQMELLHRALRSKIGDHSCPELTGRDDHGERLRGNRHAILLPLDLDGDGHLDHVLVHAKMQLGVDAQHALRSIRSTYTKGVDKPLFLTLVGMGRLADFARIGRIHVRELGAARSWKSCTPFVPPRHLKARRHTLEDQIEAELVARGFSSATIEIFGRDELVAQKFHHWIRQRRAADRKAPTHRFFGVRLTFTSEVSGPIALGYGSHFGLGLFVPDDVRTNVRAP